MYNGWKNKQTWNAGLLLANDQDTYIKILNVIGKQVTPETSVDDVAKMFREFVVANFTATELAQEIGDLALVAWDEIAETWLQEDLLV